MIETVESMSSFSHKNSRHKHQSAYHKDIVRTIRHDKRRFISIMVITMLGVMMFSGLKAACVDLRQSADRYFDAQNLHDIEIVSTLGLTQEDVTALKAVDGVENAEGIVQEDVSVSVTDGSARNTSNAAGRSETADLSGTNPELSSTAASETVSETSLTASSASFSPASTAVTSDIEPSHTEQSDIEPFQTITLKTIPESGLDRPGLSEGRYPEKSGEALASLEYLHNSGASVGDTFTVTDSSLFTEKTYTIVGAAVDVTDVDNPFGSVSYRSDSSAPDTVFLLKEDVDSDTFTSVLLTVQGTRSMFCYSDEYEAAVDGVKDAIETTIKEDRENARTKQVIQDAQEELDKNRQKARDELDEGRQALEDAQDELNRAREDGQEQIDEGWNTLREQLAAGLRQIEDGRAQLNAQLSQALYQLNAAQAQIDSGYAQLNAQSASLQETLETARTQITEGLAQISSGKEELQNGMDELAVQQSVLEKALETMKTQREELQDEIDRLTIHEDISGEETRSKTTLSEADAEETSQEKGSGQVQAEGQNQESSLGRTQESTQGQSQNQNQNQSQDAVQEQVRQLQEQIRTLDERILESETLLEEMEQSLEDLSAQKTQLEENETQLLAQQEILNQSSSSARAQIAAAFAQLESGQQSVNEGWSAYETGKAEGEAQLAAAEEEYQSGKAEGENRLQDAQQELDDQIADAQAELDDGWAEYSDSEKEAEEKLADAQQEIDDIDTASWYVRDRSALSGYANIESDADSIEVIGNVFPVVFFIVAVLISLTAVTRMVDEDRGLIGTYKSLGYTDAEIMRKYIAYSASACAAGSILGTILAFVVLPEFIFTIFSVMYLLPEYDLSFVPGYGLAGPLLFMGGILAAVLFSLRSELKCVPAVLMRPKAPRAGSRIFLEQIRPLWNRMSFLNKVTSRNLFRYKRRMFMTIFGIAGCISLLLFGFGIKDSVDDLMPRQYDRTFQYDVMAVSTTDDYETLLSYANDETDVDSRLGVRIDSVSIVKGTESGTGKGSEDGTGKGSENGKGSGKKTAKSEEIQATMIVVPDEEDLSSYISLTDTDGTPVTLSDGEIYITQNAGNVLGFKDGAEVSVQLSDLQKAEFRVTSLVRNYLGNYVYMNQSTWEKYYDDFEKNGLLMHLKAGVDQETYAENLGSRDGVVSCQSIVKMKDSFSGAFQLINAVVYIIIAMSAALAFVVLFTLSTTNISERVRELATIKVLGFYDREVHQYIDKETMILTLIGILLGLPLGRLFAQTLTWILNLPSIYLAVSLHPVSYLIAVVLTLGFALIVGLIMDRVLDRIDPVTALKSVE